MRKRKPRKSIEANQIHHLCNEVYIDCSCDMADVCVCVKRTACKEAKQKDNGEPHAPIDILSTLPAT